LKCDHPHQKDAHGKGSIPLAADIFAAQDQVDQVIVFDSVSSFDGALLAEVDLQLLKILILYSS